MWCCMSIAHHVISSCNLLVNIKGLESTLFLFRPLTKLPHPNTIYRYIGAWCRERGIGVRACVKSGPRSDIHYCEPGRRRTTLNWTSVAKKGTERASKVCVKLGQRGDIHICEPGRRRTNFYWTSVAKRGRKERVRYSWYGGHRGPEQRRSI